MEQTTLLLRYFQIHLVENRWIAGSAVWIGGFVDAKFLVLFLQGMDDFARSRVDAQTAFAEVGRIVEGMGKYSLEERLR